MTLSIPEKIRAREIKKSKSVLEKLVASFDKSELLEDAIIKTFLDPIDTPQSHYSRLNRIMLYLQGAQDARGINVWHSLKRQSLDITKQVFIWMPRTQKIKDKTGDEDKDITITTGFFLKGLYDISNTFGAKIADYEKQEPKVMPPLFDVAQKWGINVKYFNVESDGSYGYYSPDRKEIVLKTENAYVFFHELAHAAHEKIDGKLKSGGQNPQEEAIAQLTSAVLCQMYDHKMDKFTYDYILAYAKNDPTKAMQLIKKVIIKVSKVLELILETTNYSKMEAITN